MGFNTIRTPLSNLDLLPESIEILGRIDKFNLYIIKGDDHVFDNRRMGNITNSTFGPNTNIQGDHVDLENISESVELNTALEELTEVINTLNDETERDEAEMHYDMLVQSIQEDNPNRIKSCLENLDRILGSAASITTIATYFGLFI